MTSDMVESAWTYMEYFLHYLDPAKLNFCILLNGYYGLMVSLFNGISTVVGYLMPKPFSEKNSSGTI